MRAQDQALAEEHSQPPGNHHRWPPQVKYIVGNAACERFSYYGMKGILALYIPLVLLKTKDDASAAAVSTNRFLAYAGLTFVVAILFSLVAAFYHCRDESAAQGKQLNPHGQSPNEPTIWNIDLHQRRRVASAAKFSP